ncbi:unnamed protein product [Protopolystoma xenopodis]|uniref:Uncharacterized protein n=1 Tax=Protopolystoma xenopodis TaxID=117903 RepID=A0A3S5AXQ1_9PLAT|nr:unnamed protein product [Protopolystoma xenopodis]
MSLILPGVHSVLVALMAMKADILYDPAYIMPNQLANHVDELGFGAELLEATFDRSRAPASKSAKRSNKAKLKRNTDATILLIGSSILELTVRHKLPL